MDKEIGDTNRKSAKGSKARREGKRRRDTKGCHYKLQERRLKPEIGGPWMQRG
jgi:hypothetical protein